MEPGGWKDPLEAGMATHSKTLEAWQAIVNLMDRAAWQAIYSPQDCKKLDMMGMTQHSTAQYCNINNSFNVLVC